jgi:hypothetical protein
MLALLMLACAQAGDLEPILDRLGHDDAAVREKAVKELEARGPQVVPRLLALHRSTGSEEVRVRAESILLDYPFPTYVLTRADEPLQEKLRRALLDGIEAHRSLPGCWRGPQEQTPIDPARLRLQRQGGSGHGQTWELDEFVPRKEGGLVVRRIAYERPTPYRSAVREEITRAEETVLDEGETRALMSLLEAATALRATCSEEEDPKHYFWSSADFTLRFRLESAGNLVWTCAYTGYLSSSNRTKYTHGRIVDGVVYQALKHRSWTPAKIDDDDRRRLLKWFEENFFGEGWWVRERFLRVSVTVGDDSFVPFLRRVGKEVQGKQGASEMRLATSVKEGLKRITGSEE